MLWSIPYVWVWWGSHCGDVQNSSIVYALMGSMWIPLWVLFDHPSFLFAPWILVIPLCLMFNPLVSTSCFHHSWCSLPLLHFLSVLVTWLTFLVINHRTRIPRDSPRWRRVSQLLGFWFFNPIASILQFLFKFPFWLFWNRALFYSPFWPWPHGNPLPRCLQVLGLHVPPYSTLFSSLYRPGCPAWCFGKWLSTW